MDSTTLLYWLLNRGDDVSALSFVYGQRHVREVDAARSICTKLGVGHKVSILPHIAGSSLTGQSKIPHGHYEEESMKSTVVPNRNMIMIAHATSVAIAGGFNNVAYAAHSGDHAIYPDCRDEFLQVMRKAIKLCDWAEIELVAPFVHLDKIDIASIGDRLGVPFDMTWTCYEGGDVPCGKCGACVERSEALETIGK